MKITDQYGGGISSAVITLSLFTDSGCSVLAAASPSGNSVSSATGGFANFTSFKMETAGIYYAKASGGSVYSSCSSTILTVVAGAASSISYTTQPAGTVLAGASLTTQPVVIVKDTYDNPVSGKVVTLLAYNSDCSVALLGTVANGVLTTGVSGTATFTLVSYSKVETIYLKASTDALEACSSSATISANVASSLTWSTAITTSSVVAGNNFATSALQLTDAYGNLISGTTITLTLYDDSACLNSNAATVTGNTQSTSSGIATFSTFQTTLQGVYFVKGSTGSVYSACSGANGGITVLAAALDSISFIQQPAGSVAAGLSFTTQPIIQAVDQYGNVLNAQTVTLTPFLDGSCSSAGSSSLGNGVTSTSISGNAAFINLYYTSAETIYLKATSGNFSNND